MAAVIVVDALAAAMDRGADVRLVLDDDLPEDYDGANAVSRNTFTVMADRGIPVPTTWRSPRTLRT